MVPSYYAPRTIYTCMSWVMSKLQRCHGFSSKLPRATLYIGNNYTIPIKKDHRISFF